MTVKVLCNHCPYFHARHEPCPLEWTSVVAEGGDVEARPRRRGRRMLFALLAVLFLIACFIGGVLSAGWRP